MSGLVFRLGIKMGIGWYVSFPVDVHSKNYFSYTDCIAISPLWTNVLDTAFEHQHPLLMLNLQMLDVVES